jgi:hypothetical protein
VSGLKSILSSIVRFIGYIFIGLLAIVLIVCGFSMLFGPPVSPKDIAVATVTGALSANPEVNNMSGKTRHSNIRLLLNKYPNRSFNIDGDAYFASKWGMVNDYVFAGDSMTMEVAADDFKNNLELQTAPDHMLPVAVYSLRDKEHTYLTLTDYCKEANSSVGAGIVALIMGLGMALALILGFRKKRKRKA